MDEMNSDDVESKIEAISHLRDIAVILGPDRTRKELVPFINSKFTREMCLFYSSLTPISLLLMRCIEIIV